MNYQRTLKMAVSAAYLALALLLPFLTGQIPQIGSMLSPMHIPVLLCGFTCGWPWGLAIGFIAPLLRFLIFGMPPLYPTGIAMAFELATYGALSGLLHAKFPKTLPFTYLALVSSMLAGRCVWGILRLVLTVNTESTFTWAMFMSGAFTSAIPAIILHIALIPPIIVGLQKAKLIPLGGRHVHTA